MDLSVISKQREQYERTAAELAELEQIAARVLPEHQRLKEIQEECEKWERSLEAKKDTVERLKADISTKEARIKELDGKIRDGTSS